ncbi:MAG: bifunctional phosphoribosyl-AMP cyclohydrolase/phosphoribosyl-ATP diphosphatase HisIE [Brevinematales bacterium]|nr:bifunctional phosphoribosyl-AMP cyclohydrolase/phosphoribosyl-ATP diphosphatase HisIE [Brevinematales bacterium]
MSIDFNIDSLKFDGNGLLPAIIQDAISGKVLMLGYMNKEALIKTLETGKTWFYSRSRKTLWNKGETSGNYHDVKEIFYDCDEDTLLVKVIPSGPTCHTNNYSCFYRKIIGSEGSQTNKASILFELYQIILERKRLNPENSYVAKKMREGIDRILKKIGEEAGEVIIAGKNGNKEEISWEVADLIFHLFLVLAYYDMSLDEVYDRLIERKK